MGVLHWCLVGLVAAGMLQGSARPEGTAKGSYTYRGETVQLRFAYLVRGPDAVDPSVTIRRVILSTTSLDSAVAACQTMSCLDGAVREGMTLELDAGPRLNYWVALRNGAVQYSGTARPAVLSVARQAADRLAGKLDLDDSQADGPRVSVEFDAPLLATLTRAR